MRNNNQAVVRKIARRGIDANRGRNAFILLAVFLTTFMLGTIISIGISYMESVETYRVRFEGTTAHAGLANMNDEQIEKLKTLDYVSHYATGYTVADINPDGNHGISAMLVWLDTTNWNVFRKPAFSNIVGHYPQSHHEIMVPRWIMDGMGIAEPKIGMEITVTYQIDREQPQTQTFALSGWFTSYIRLQAGGNEGMLVSREFAALSGHTVEKDGNVQIQYIDEKRVTEYNERLARDLGIDAAAIYTIAKYHALSEASIDPFYIVCAVLALFLLLAGYLLIHNVLSVSVSRDIRFYGLLKTIGTTPRQIRKSIFFQMLSICCVGVPVGLVLSALFSFVFIPGLITNMSGDIMKSGAVISGNPLIYIGAAAFAVITALTGALIPARRAAGISPIEAVRFSEQGNINRKNKKYSGFNALKVAWRNVFRVRKRAVLVFASLFLGMTMFLAVTTILDSTSIDKMVESSMESIAGDIFLRNLRPNMARQEENDNADLQVFTPEFMRDMASLPGLTEIKTSKIYPLKMDLGVTDMQGNFLFTEGEAIGLTNDEIAELCEDMQFTFDVAAFERGEFIILQAALTQTEKESVEVVFVTVDDPITLKIGGHIEAEPMQMDGAYPVYPMPQIYMSNNLLQELVSDPIIHGVSIFIDEPSQREALEMIKALTSGRPDIRRTSAFEIHEEMSKIKATMLTIGGGISVILWLIGILNFANILTTSILSRQHEIALMESIGQSPKQSRKMLTSEGGIYAVITLLLVGIFGGALTYGLFSVLARQFDYVVFSFPYVPLAIMVAVVLAVCSSMPRMVYGIISKVTLVERLREAE